MARIGRGQATGKPNALRVKRLLSGQDVRDYNPLRRDRFERLKAPRTGDGRELPPILKEKIRRELDRIWRKTGSRLASKKAKGQREMKSARRKKPPCEGAHIWAIKRRGALMA